MALDRETNIAVYEAPEKDLYEVGEMPPLGHVPAKMYAWAIRRERHGEPDTAFQVEVVDIPQVGAQDCLLYTSPSPRDRQKSRMPSSA